MNDIDIYNNTLEVLERKESNVYKYFIILVITSSIILMIACFINYPKIYHFEGTVSDNKIILYLDKNSLGKLKGSTLKINNEETYYDIDSITELDYNINNIKYYLVKLFTNKNLIENNVVNVYINDGKTNIFKCFVKRIWKGFNNV